MLIDPTAAFAADGHQHARIGRSALEGLVGTLLGPSSMRSFPLYVLAVGLPTGVVRFGRRVVDPIQRKILALILAEQADRVGAALAAVLHQIGAIREFLLQRLQLRGRRSALPCEAEVGAVRRIGDQRHDVVQEGATPSHLGVDLLQMLVVNAGDHHRIDLDQQTGGNGEIESLPLPLD